MQTIFQHKWYALFLFSVFKQQWLQCCTILFVRVAWSKINFYKFIILSCIKNKNKNHCKIHKWEKKINYNNNEICFVYFDCIITWLLLKLQLCEFKCNLFIWWMLTNPQHFSWLWIVSCIIFIRVLFNFYLAKKLYS